MIDGIRAADHRGTSRPRRTPWLLAAAAVALIAGTVSVVVAGEDGDQRVDVTSDPDETLPTTSEPDADVTDLGLWCNIAPTDVAVFMEAGARPAEHDVARDEIERDARVQAVRYVDIDESYEIFVETFADQPELLVAVTPEDVPAAFLVDLTDASTSAAASDDFATIDGVYETLPEPCPAAVAPPNSPAQAVAVSAQGHVLVIDTSTGDVIRDLGGFDDPTDPAVADREGGAFSITGVALHPNGRDVYVETCCEPASGVIFRVPIDGSVPISFDTLEPVAYGYGIDISADGRWLAYVSSTVVSVMEIETGDVPYTAETADGSHEWVQAAINADGTVVAIERVLERSADGREILRSDARTSNVTTGAYEEHPTVEGRFIPIWIDGGEVLASAATPGTKPLDSNVDASGTWILEVTEDGSLVARSEEHIRIPGGPYVAADW
jgi:hypothetical protein